MKCGELMTEWWIAASSEGYWGRRYLLLDMVKFSNQQGRMPGNYTQRSRRDFNSRRNEFPLASACFMCSGRYDGTGVLVRHHIIPLSMYGSNRRYNICTLCWDCHAEIHPWLKKSYTP